MVGREVSAIYTRAHSTTLGEELLKVENLSRGKTLKNISFSVRAGEIVGLGGLIGAGRTELCRAIFGLDPIDSGTVTIAGVQLKAHSPRQSVQAGLAMIPEDRQKSGLATGLPIGYNVTMASLGALSSFGFLRHAQDRQITSDYVSKLRIKCSSGAQLAGRLSGGNQQKVVIAKWLARGARVFLFDEPTRGIDVGAKMEVFEVMNELAKSGAAVLMVSSELPELVQVPDRILVMREGQITGELPAGSSQEDIMRLAAPQEQTT
jgi:ABC-type sugar transport system ATPase subunit